MGYKYWNNLEDIISIQERVNKIYEDAYNELTVDDIHSKYTWSPKIDIYETKKDFVLKAEIPGIKESDISINIDNDILTIQGERTQRHEKLVGYHCMERNYGKFIRSFRLPKSINYKEIKAGLSDGILTIFIPKKKFNAIKKIDVRTAND